MTSFRSVKKQEDVFFKMLPLSIPQDSPAATSGTLNSELQTLASSMAHVRFVSESQVQVTSFLKILWSKLHKQEKFPALRYKHTLLNPLSLFSVWDELSVHLINPTNSGSPVVITIISLRRVRVEC